MQLVTARVIQATCSQQFRNSTVQWASEEAKEIAKQWVEDNSCPAWRDGWLMVDGTLVPLFQRPAFFGNTWFDRKSNYSMNVQVWFYCIHYISGLTFDHYVSCRLSIHLILSQSTLLLVFQVANTILRHGLDPILIGTGRCCCLMVNGCGLILRIHSQSGAHPRIRSILISISVTMQS